jgi:hypothetical protein
LWPTGLISETGTTIYCVGPSLSILLKELELY